MKKQFLILFAFISVLALSQVPQRFNKVIVTGDITSPKFIKTGSNADSVLLGNGSARSVNSLKTDTVNLSNRINAKATGSGTASGNNTGDETLTSIKTKLGAASAVSDGYLKYQDYVKFDGKLSSEVDGSTTNELQTISTTGAAGNITLSNSGGTLNLNVNDADASTTNEIQDLSLSGNTLSLSSDATTVNISQATAVLANTAKVSNVNHTGDATGSTALTLATVNSNVGTFNNVTINAKGLATAGSNVSYEPAFSKNSCFNKNFGTTPGTVLEGRTFGTAANSAVGDFQPTITGLTVNNFPIWNGAAFINSRLINTANGITLSSNTTPNMVFTGWGVVDPIIYFGRYSGTGLDNAAKIQYEYRAASSQESGSLSFWTNPNAAGAGSLTKRMTVGYDGVVNIHSTTPSTSPTTGALVVDGGIGADHVRANQFYGNGSNLTGVQLPITLTTNGTSGAATFSGNVLNVPNYGNVATSGHYTPTLTNTANIASSSIIADANYSRIGNIVTITLSANVTPTLIGTLTHLTFTLPITTVSTSQQYIGSGVAWFGSSSSIGTFSVESASTAVFLFVPTTTSTFAVSGTFQYRID